MLFCYSQLYAIALDLGAQCIKLDLAKHFRVPLCKSYDPETSIFLVAADGFYSPDTRPRDIREVKDKERLVTLLVWGHNAEVGSWEPIRSSGHRPTGPTQRGLPKG